MAAVVVVIVVWGGFLAARTWSAYQHDRRGLARLDQVRADLDPGQPHVAGIRTAPRCSAGRVRRGAVGPFVALVLTHHHRARDRPPVPLGPGPQHRGGNGVGRGRHVPDPGTRCARPAKRGRSPTGGVAPSALRDRGVGPSTAGPGRHRPLAGAGGAPGLQAQRVRPPARRSPVAADQCRRRLCRGGLYPPGAADLRGAGRQQRRDAGRVGDLPRCRCGHDVGRVGAGGRDGTFRRPYASGRRGERHR